MTQDDIIRFAIQCRLVTTGNRDGLYINALTEFAKLVAEKEREACAKVCDVLAVRPEYVSEVTKLAGLAIRLRGRQFYSTYDSKKSAEVSVEAGLQCAAAIRARGQA